jgi:xanthine dehydrogenase large subunit
LRQTNKQQASSIKQQATMKNTDSKGHVTGRSIYIDDIPEQAGTLHAAVVLSPVAHGIIKSIDFTLAEKTSGVVRIITADDIPGENQIGSIVQDEQLFADPEIHFTGQPVALIVATDRETAWLAAEKVAIDIEEKKAVTDVREAAASGDFLVPPRTFQQGDIQTAWHQCDHIIEGSATSAGQEHLYLETQGSYTVPAENGNIKIYASTQGPTAVQLIAARVLNFPMHKIEVDVNRLGGGFGGKEDQATPWAVMAALGTYLTGKAVKLILPRHIDLRVTGKRHPYEYDFKIGLNKELKIVAFQADYYQNGGAATDLSPAIMERTLFHITNAYFIPNVKGTVYCCRTNLPPNTAFRGFGAPQAMFLMEAAIAKAAETIGVSVADIQKTNLIRTGETFPYGQAPDQDNAVAVWNQFDGKFNLNGLEQQVKDYNASNLTRKKGFALMPVCFGISFTNTSMNQARALVHIYQDGSIGISTGAVEMGQGVNTKMMQVAASVLSVDVARVKIETTNTTRVANTSPTAASSGADLNGKALETACNKLKEKLIKVAAGLLNSSPSLIEIKNEHVLTDGKATNLTWERLVMEAHLARIGLTENGHYATPVIHFDKSKEKGHPFAYYVFGMAGITATVDTVRGTYQIDDVRIVHDFGKSMNRTIDHGQIEGAVVQGIGWVTIEELAFSESGKLLSDSLSTYKVPDIYSAPQKIVIEDLKTEGTQQAIFKSKAVGEPPFNYGIGAFFAIQNAMKAFREDYRLNLNLPVTHEKVLTGLYKTDKSIQ